MTAKERFIKIYKETIKREGADKLLDYLCRSDFFTSPARARYHSAYAGGLCEHSLNVYDCLVAYLQRERVKNEYAITADPESVSIVALLHDICKIGCYKISSRNVKDENGKWQSVPYYEFQDPLPYGHGEKSVYIINGYLRHYTLVSLIYWLK